MTDRLKTLSLAIENVTWALMILLLPVTSAPLIARLTGASTVAPLAILPLLVFALFWLLPYLFRKGTFSRLSIPFLGFILVALIASARAFFLDIPAYQEKSIPTEEFEAIATLTIGGLFYLISASWPRSSKRLTLTLQLINWSGFLTIIWSLVQAYFIWFNNGRYPFPLVQFHDLISVRDLFRDRVTGFTFEPSWLAHQLNLLYLPYWLASSLQQNSAHRVRIFGLRIENLLLFGGILTLLLSQSRIGILAFLLVATFLYAKTSRHLIRRWVHKVANRRQEPPAHQGNIHIGLSLVLGCVALIIYLGSLMGLVYGISRYDYRLEVLFNPEIYASGNFYTIINNLAFAERVVYWVTGWEIFNDYPFLGVGLGNAGFFFIEKMPDFGWALWETTQTFFRLSFLPNIKSMWVRILAETGLVGFSFFIVWYYFLLRFAGFGYQHRKGVFQTLALMGQFVLLSFIIEGISIDSFALPYFWVSVGLLTSIHTEASSKTLQPDNHHEPPLDSHHSRR